MSQLKIDMISDLHMYQPTLKGGDILLCAGDITSRGRDYEVDDMLSWLNKQKYKHIVFIAGNHDWLFEKDPEGAEHILSKYPNLTYLNDSGITIEGLKIWGSPITPWFCDWAFNRFRGQNIQKHWDIIPDDIDILITHGPPYGILDETILGDKVGCIQLRSKIEQIKPKLHLFGHIHEGYGEFKEDGITYVNASIMDDMYQPVNKPITTYLEAT